MKLPILLLLLLTLMSPRLLAQDSDSEQPVYIEADSAFYDEKTGTSTYTGNVILDQGDLHITADKVIATSNQGKLVKVVAYGKPVRFKQAPKPGKEAISGVAKQAEYLVDREYIILIKEAVVHQGENSYASDRIEYDQINGIVKAGETTSNSKRVKIILHPKTDDSKSKQQP